MSNYPRGYHAHKYLVHYNRDMEILEMRIRRYTLNQIADRFGLSYERIRQILQKMVVLGLACREDLPKRQVPYNHQPFVSIINPNNI